MAAALAGTLAGAGDAIADDTLLTQAAPPALALASTAAIAHIQEAPASPEATPSTEVNLLLGKPPENRAKAAPSGPKKVPLLTDEILRELGELPLINTVMAPVTRGVTIDTGDGRELTLAVKPTKITRGSGLVAIGKF